MIDYKQPPLPATDWTLCTSIPNYPKFIVVEKPAWDEKQVKEYAEEATAPLLAEIERLEKFIQQLRDQI